MSTAAAASLEQNKALYRDFIETIFNRGELQRLDEFLSPAYGSTTRRPGRPPGPPPSARS